MPGAGPASTSGGVEITEGRGWWAFACRKEEATTTAKLALMRTRPAMTVEERSFSSRHLILIRMRRFPAIHPPTAEAWMPGLSSGHDDRSTTLLRRPRILRQGAGGLGGKQGQTEGPAGRNA